MFFPQCQCNVSSMYFFLYFFFKGRKRYLLAAFLILEKQKARGPRMGIFFSHNFLSSILSYFTTSIFISQPFLHGQGSPANPSPVSILHHRCSPLSPKALTRLGRSSWERLPLFFSWLLSLAMCSRQDFQLGCLKEMSRLEGPCPPPSPAGLGVA